MRDVAVVGAGIVGLATAAAISTSPERRSVVVIDKEGALGAHQTGHNSGVIHAGVYYRPGSLKADYCRRGNAAMKAFCAEHAIPFESCGKLIVAVDEGEVPRLEALHQRAIDNGLTVERLGPAGLRDHEPHVRGVAGLHVADTGITDYRRVCEALGRQIQDAGGEIRLGAKVAGIHVGADSVQLRLADGPAGAPADRQADGRRVEARSFVNCAGLHSDRVLQLAGERRQSRIVPFRGEYYELADHARPLVRGLIYPVPDPSFPFLGVHLTRMIDGSVHAGPNAVLALRREGYRWREVSARDLADVVTYGGFWKLARKHGRQGAAEVVRSLSKALFLRSLQRLVPDLRSDDLVPTHAGVRAQALAPTGALVDDFQLVDGPRSLHVCNAPSPAATSSLVIGEIVAQRIAAT